MRGEKNMKRVGALLGMVILLGFVVGINVYAQQQNPSSQEKAEQESQSQETSPSAKTASTLQGVMLASDTIIGASVTNEQGEAVGEIQRLHISPTYGVILYAELGVDGFLGMQEKTIMVPWKAIKIAQSGESLVLTTSK
jgi:sporulation protein YlmC with PRC-barrel domain